jgi:hypothetical protein
MNGASKILTVSYGTFSCTLEGFQDPFNTMKAIAEYFRDLAAEDRYFGAEPPQPDAAMLHKIAEREIHRRVEAKIQENGVILRTGDAMSEPWATPNPPPALAPQTEQVPEASLAAATIPPEAARAAPSLPVDVSPSDSVAAKLQRIRAANATNAAPEALTPTRRTAEAAPEPVPEPILAQPFVSPADPYSEDEHAEAGNNDDVTELLSSLGELATPDASISSEMPEDLPEDDHEADFSEAADFLPEDLPEDAQEQLTSETVTADPFAELQDEPDDEELAELARLDAPANLDAGSATDLPTLSADDDTNIAARHLAEAQDDWDLDEDADDLDELATPAPVKADQPVDDLNETTDLADRPLRAAAVQEDPSYSDMDNEDEDAFLSNLQSQLDEGMASQSVAGAPLDATEPDNSFTAWGDEDLDEDQDGDAAEATEAPSEVPQDEVFAEAPEAADAADAVTEAAPEILARAQRARARVIKIRRAQPEQGIVQPAEPDLAPEAPMSKAVLDEAPIETPEPAPELDPAPAGALSPEDEDALMRELAELQDDEPVAMADTTDVPVSTVRPVRPQRPVGGRGTTDVRQGLSAQNGDEAVSRLIAQTNSQMEGPESRRRLSAIAHLKAAVVATVAERRVGGDQGPTEKDRIDPYRNDLSRIVRPTPARPATTERPSPLVLVSEQRIDRRVSDPAPVASGPAGPVSPVRPRRIAATPAAITTAQELDDDEDDLSDDGNIFVDAGGFADFADRIGAHSLADLLEAAAAYTATVEGRPHFSRPQILRQVATLEPEASREDGMRGFGTLLRAGTIERVKRGQYVLSEQSRFLAEAKKIVG